MSTKSKAEPTRRKSKSVSRPKATQLTPAMIEAHAEEKARKEFRDFMDNYTEAEMRVVRHLKRIDFSSMVEMMKEVRRLLGESIAKCKVIPFPSPTQTDLDRRIAEVLESLAHPQRPELVVVPNREQGCMNHENTVHGDLSNESSESERKRKTEVGLVDTIH